MVLRPGYHPIFEKGWCRTKNWNDEYEVERSPAVSLNEDPVLVGKDPKIVEMPYDPCGKAFNLAAWVVCGCMATTETDVGHLTPNFAWKSA